MGIDCRSVVCGKIVVDYKKLGARIARCRREQHLKQKDLAVRLHKSSKHISNIECAKSKPSLELLLQISYVLHVSVDYFISGACRMGAQTPVDGVLELCSERDQQIMHEIVETFLKYQDRE